MWLPWKRKKECPKNRPRPLPMRRRTPEFNISWEDLDKPKTASEILKWPRGELNGLFARATAEIGLLSAEVERLTQELERIKSVTWCLYCGKEYTLDSSGEQLEEHIKVCPKHPVPNLCRENERLRTAIETYCTEFTDASRLGKRQWDLMDAIGYKPTLSNHDAGPH